MRLAELSLEYGRQAEALKGRIRSLESACPAKERPGELEWRIKTLRAMYREAASLAVLCGRYYERGYSRNARYRL